MTLTGSVESVSAIDATTGRATVVVAIKGANSLGDHVTGTVRLTVPQEGAK